MKAENQAVGVQRQYLQDCPRRYQNLPAQYEGEEREGLWHTLMQLWTTAKARKKSRNPPSSRIILQASHDQFKVYVIYEPFLNRTQLQQNPR